MPENQRLGRELIEVIQIGQDYCQKEYGVTCDASLATGGRKCFHTRATCQDPANYERGILWINFCSNQASIPRDAYYHPFIRKVKVTPGAINPGGASRILSSLGRRAVIDVDFIDAPSPDRVVDPYQAERISGGAQADGVGYDPFERGTFWSKWRARNPFYLGRPIRRISGYLVDGLIEDSITETFFITGFSGPAAGGSVRITGKDILSQISNEKAVAPALSSGKLVAGIDDNATSVTLTPTGIGDEEYTASGIATMGDETVTFTRSGDTFTIVRGQRGTTPDSHDSGTLFQVGLEFTSQRPDDIQYTLLSEYGGIAGEYLDTAGWEAEVDDHLQRLYSRTITSPTGIAKLISELSENVGYNTWWDQRTNLLKMRAWRAAEDETIYELDRSRHFVKDSVTITDLHDQRVSDVVVWYGVRDPNGDLTDTKNYLAAEAAIDVDVSSAAQNGAKSIRHIFGKWIPATGGAIALELAQRVLAMYKQVPQEVKFSLDAKDRDIWVGSFARLRWRNVVDDAGEVRPFNVQVIRANEASPGHRLSYTAHSYVAEAFVNPSEKLVIISGTENYNLNLRDVYDQTIGVAPTSGEKVRFILRANARIGGKTSYDLNSQSTYVGEILVPGNSNVVVTGDLPIVQSAFYAPGSWARGFSHPTLGELKSDLVIAPVATSLATGDWPEGPVLELLIEPGALVLGQGANGGIHYARDGSSWNYVSADGGHALRVDYPISIDNRGVIGGGGGGGAGLIHAPVSTGTPVPEIGVPKTVNPGMIIPGGGGGGWPGGVTVGPYIGSGFYSSAGSPAAGSTERGGQGAQSNRRSETIIATTYQYWVGSGAGGSTVSYQVAPSAGLGSYSYQLFTGGFFPLPVQVGGPYGEGGSPGKAIVSGSGDVTWINKGVVLGVES